MAKGKLLIFTDLDGSLLDHHTYSWAPALEALTLIKEQHIPLVLCSSKTLAELEPIAQALQTDAPLIGENGAVIAYREDGEEKVRTFGTSYSAITQYAHELRQTFGFEFIGFSDMSIAEVMQYTELGETAAIAAKKRQASEPLLWQDSEAQLKLFQRELEKRDLILTKGGRFHHIMSPVDKAMAVNWVREYYQEQEPGAQWRTMGLGDSHNDISMLESTNHPVLIKNPYSCQPDVTHIKHIQITEAIGPEGWNAAVIATVTQLRHSGVL